MGGQSRPHSPHQLACSPVACTHLCPTPPRRHVFGLNGGPLLCFADEGAVAYAAGHYAVVHQADSRTQRFVPASPESQGITALAVCHAKKLLALAERCGDRPTVTVFDLQTLKRRKVLTLAESGAKVGGAGRGTGRCGRGVLVPHMNTAQR